MWWPLLGLVLAFPMAPLQAADGPCATRCRELGECVPQSGGRCVAVFDEDCMSSLACTRFGRCTVREGVCSATSDTDCAASDLCGERGECTARGGHCEVASDDACRASTGCRDDGRCTLGDGECVVGSSDDCEGSEQCRAEGACGQRGEACVPTLDTHCASSERCATDGRCALVDGVCDISPAEDTGLAEGDDDPDPPIRVSGPLKRNAVRKTLREVRADALRCGPLTADVELSASILPNGKVTGIAVLGVPRKQERCIAKTLKRRRFPERNKPTALTWRLHRPD
jgi:hypothetical protein